MYNIYQKGQALVLVLLSLAVILTLVLFILSRTVTDVAVSGRQADAVRAFSAAEAGVERSLIVGVSSGVTQIGDASYSANVTDIGLGSSTFSYPINLFSGDDATLWFTAHDSNSNQVCDATHKCFKGRYVNVCWGKQGTSGSSPTTPALEAVIIYETTPGDPATAQIARVAVDPSASRSSQNQLNSVDPGTCTVNGQTYQFQKLIDFNSLGIPAGSYGSENGLQYAFIRLLYNTDTSQPIAFDITQSLALGGNPLPSQGLNIDATGNAGQSNRRLNVFQSWPEAPAAFQFAVYTNGSITK